MRYDLINSLTVVRCRLAVFNGVAKFRVIATIGSPGIPFLDVPC